jgi:hypothetical protein
MRFRYLIILLLTVSCNRQTPKEKVADPAVREDTAASNTSAQVTQSLNCTYDNPVASLGIGLVIVPEKFTLFSDSLLNDQFVSVNMMEEGDPKVCSKFYSPEYEIMHFVCLDSTGTSYKVHTTNSTVKFLPKTPGYSFKTWTSYLLQSYGVKLLFAGEQNRKLQQEPNFTSGSIPVPADHEMFCAVAIEGDWIKVTYDCFYSLEENEHAGKPCSAYIDACKNSMTGWTKWKQGNQLLIEIFLIP